ncbi:hypothetical protein FG386_000938 [Cryptosporidium ryanae]|uniref:uncharacterized protein n=1 Tax=Cryptosporidium ryanae TaxID=515981 RepID=UPI00351AA8FE|nr:hypothetical protein FG386_000938 [Cryptosporidium ryanae]
MFFSSGGFGESPFSRNDGNSSTRSSSISKETSNSYSYLNSNENTENRWSNNVLTPSRNSSLTTNNGVLSSNSRNDSNKIKRMCLPVTISMIKRNLDASQTAFTIFGMRISSVTLVGWIMQKEILASRMIFRVSDGTGGIDARYDIDSEVMGDEVTDYLGELREGTLVRLVGQVVPGKGDILPYLSCYTIMKIEHSEYAYYHPIEVNYVLGQLGELNDVYSDDSNNNKEDYFGISNLKVKGEDSSLTKGRSGIDFELLRDIDVPDDITDTIQKNVYKTLAYELNNIKDERKKSYGVNKETLIGLLKPHYQPNIVNSALLELESKYAVIYESINDHYCVL